VAGTSWISEMTALGDRVFFVANPKGAETGALWVSDGTAAGTHTVKDIDPTRTDAVSSLAATGNRLFFVARDATHGFELWKSDGTVSGTRMVRDIRTGAASSKLHNLIASGNRLFFMANDGVHGMRFWTSDGTRTGTIALGATGPWAYDSMYTPDHATIGGSFYFAGRGAGGIELWTSNGTAAGTHRVADVNRVGDSTPSALANVGGTLYFSADDGTSGREFWTSDGTSAGTALVTDLNTATRGSDPRSLTAMGGNAFFTANDGVHGWELWKTDGTAAGTAMLKDIFPGARSSIWDASQDYGYPPSMARIGNQLYFVADDGVNGFQIWKTNGTSAGTRRVTDIAGNLSPDVPLQLTPLGSKLLFVVEEDHGTSLEVTDGTAAGTLRLSQPGSQSTYRTVVGRYPDSTFHGYLWKTDGTKAGTVRVPFDFGNFSPGYLAAVGSTLYFEYGRAGGHTEIWKTNGTAASTIRVKKLPQASGDNGAGPLVNVGGRLFFTNDRSDETDGSSVPQLWTSDGTSAGTTLLHEFVVYQTPANFTAVGTTLFFTADDGGNGMDLWKSDGTAAGTVCVKEATDFDPLSLRAIDGMLYFAGRGPTGYELYTSDGTTVGTVPVADLNPNDGQDGSSSPSEFTKLGSSILFTADDGSHGRELWTMPAP
jgi:ELWxxDGT repeat protein